MNYPRAATVFAAIALPILSGLLPLGCTTKTSQPGSPSVTGPAVPSPAPMPAEPKAVPAPGAPAPQVPLAPQPPPAEPKPAPAPAATGQGSPDKEACAKDLDQIRKVFLAIPEDYREAKNLDQLRSNVQACRDQAEKFLAGCQGAEGIHEAQFILGKLLLNLSRVEWDNFIKQKTKDGVADQEIVKLRAAWIAKYFGRIVDLATAALGRTGPGEPLRTKCLDLLSDALYQAERPAEALQRYEQLLQEFPKHDRLASTYMAMARCHMDLGSQGKGIEILRKAMKELSADPSYTYFLELLWKLQTSAGDLAGLLRLVDAMRSDLPPRLQKDGIKQLEKETIERTLAYSGFRLGYIRFALGEFPSAAQAFREHIASMDALQKSKGQIPPEYQVFRTRSMDNLEVLENFAGKPVPEDLQKVHWVGDRKPLLDGKAIAIIFRSYGWDRPVSFIQALDKHARTHRDEYELVTITYMKGSQDSLGAQSEEILGDARTLGLECAVGIDPDAQNKKLFQAFHATIGTATLVILDRAGNYAWFQQDPWQPDIQFSIAILERIAGKATK